METEKMRGSIKEWVKENGLLLLPLSSEQYNSPKAEAAWQAFVESVWLEAIEIIPVSGKLAESIRTAQETQQDE